MIAPRLDFNVLKQTVSIKQVLVAKGLAERFKVRGNRLTGPCPIHRGDNPSAFSVSLSKNLWYCFTGCQAGGNVIHLIQRLEGLTPVEAAERLASLASLAPLSDAHHGSEKPITRQPKEERPFRPYTRRLYLDPCSSFLKQKGITADTARTFEAGAHHGPGFLQGCIGVRIHDPDGHPLGYAGRRLDREQVSVYGKWKLPPKLPKRHILYGFHRLPRIPGRTLCIVEGPWDVMRLYQIGVPAVALLGLYLSPSQRRLLTSAARLIIMLDGDPNGRRASKQLLQNLADIADVQIVKLPHRCDPDDLSDLHLRRLLGSFFS